MQLHLYQRSQATDVSELEGTCSQALKRSTAWSNWTRLVICTAKKRLNLMAFLEIFTTMNAWNLLLHWCFPKNSNLF